MYDVIVCNSRGEELCRYDLHELSEAKGTSRRVLIGRAEDCGLRLRVGTVSRHHCSVELDEDGRWIVRDLGSTHGTHVGESRIEQVPLEDHLAVRIGPAVIRFEPTAAALAQRLREDVGAVE